MAHLDPQEASEHFQERVLEGIRQHFPMEGKVQTLSLKNLEVKDNLHPDDIRTQHRAKMDGGSWCVPVYATLELKDNATGKVIDTQRMRVAEIPKMTKRYSYIVDGQEYQVDNQWQLKPGIYTKRRQNGELESRFNISGRQAFDIIFEPKTNRFLMDYGKSHLPIYPILKTMGVDDDALEKAWGKKIFAANRDARGVAGAVERLYKADKKVSAPSLEEAKQHLYDTFLHSKLRPEATALTLGKPFEHVTGEALRLATERLLKVQGGAPEDDRDNLVFKDLRTVGDFAYDKLRQAGMMVRYKVARKINTAQSVRDVIKFGLFNEPIGLVFHKNSAARVASQINPVEMVSASQQTTIMGPGGIQSGQAVTSEAKFVNPSHLGFLDPIHTPEGEKTGITLRLPLGVVKQGSEPKIHLYNIVTGKMDLLSPAEIQQAKVVLPDQVRWEKGKPIPLTPNVKMNMNGQQIRVQKYADATHILKSASQLFNITSNLIPFLGSTNGNRASMATRHIEQAISLTHRDNPLVQVATGVQVKGLETFENLLGQQASHHAPVAGVVTDVRKDAILLQGHDGTKHEVQLYQYYPLNDAKSVLHSTPLAGIKVGTRVQDGQTLADTNFSKNGTLALGTNLRVGYLPYKGYNFEDGIVISDSAAKKLSSEHLQKHTLTIEPDTIFDSKKFRIEQVGKFTDDQFKKIGDDGVVKVGTKVQPGDPLVIAMKPFKLKDRTGLAAVRRSFSAAHVDKSLRWDSDFEGTVVGAQRSGKEVVVHVQTTEPMQVGDKMCFDEETEVLTVSGWKPIAAISLGDAVCCLVDGHIVYQPPTELHRYPSGGRMYRLKSQQVDLFVTEAHRMYVRPRGAAAYGLYPARDIAQARVRYLKSGSWRGVDPGHVVLPALRVTAGQHGHGERDIPAQAIPLHTYLGLLGAFLSNGSTFEQASSGSYGISLDKASGPQFEELCAFLQAGDVPFSVVRGETCSRARIYSKQLLEHFKVFGHALEKYIPQEVFEYSSTALAILLKWLLWGDGSSDLTKSRSYFTSSKRLADDVQRLCLHVGCSANVYMRKTAGWYDVNGTRSWCAAAYRVAIVTKKNAPQVNHGHTKEQGEQVEEWVEGYAKPVYCPTVPGNVLYVRRNGIPVWSGNSGRHGNKGIVCLILPDKEMPHTKDGNHIEVALNPSGIPGRMNIGQVFETVAGKIAQKTGKPYLIKNFEAQTDQLTKIKGELAAHGLHDTEELFDPATKMSLGKALVGPQHMLKLVHQVDKKISARSGMASPGSSEHYDFNLQPTSGAGTGGQSMGVLGLYAMLAHGSKANIREMQTWKSEGQDSQTNPTKQWQSQHNQVWTALQTGLPLPTPTSTFVFQKFSDMLRATGINLEKKGHQFALSPLTDAHILKLSAGALPRATETIDAKYKDGEPITRPGGIFDEKLTGGLGGRKWSHIALAEPLPNPIFEKPICRLTGLLAKDYYAVVTGGRAVTPTGQLTDVGHGLTGGAAIKMLLDRVDVKKDLAKAKKELAGTRAAAKLDPALKKVKYLQALDQLGLKPSEAYILHNLPVIPPVMRPISPLPSGDIKLADLNGLYKSFAQVNEKLKDPFLNKHYTDVAKVKLRENLYDGVKALMGIGLPYEDKKNKQKGVIQQIAGSSPKHGYFQNTLMDRRQDLTMRSTIVPEPALGLDEVGLPKDAALTLFKPFVVKQLKDMGFARNALEAQKLLEQKTPTVWRALDQVMANRPVLLKRDPALHKYSVQGFNAKAVSGNAIQIHPLVTGGFTADFDGDTMSVFVPISHEAVQEARAMMPSNNLFSEATGHVMYQPTLESALGLYKLSVTGKDTGKTFAHEGAVLDAVRKGDVSITDVVHVGTHRTTGGRVLLAAALPAKMQEGILHDLDFRIDKKGLKKLFTDVATEHTKDFGVIANRLKDMGNGAAYGLVAVPARMNSGHNFVFHDKAKIADTKTPVYIPIGTHSLSLDDFTTDKKVREGVLGGVREKVKEIYDNPNLQAADKDRRAILLWEAADKEMKKRHVENETKKPSNLFIMHQSGVKPGWDQYKQMIIAPMLFQDSSGKTLPTPVTQSYAEGLDVGGYWDQMPGARRGSVMKVQEVQEPGYMSKLLMNNTMHIVVDSHDCGTAKGIALDVHDRDVHDRFLAEDFRAGLLHIPVGTKLSPDILGQMRAANKNARIVVRSPLKCESEKGLCQMCVGLDATGELHPKGTAIGILSSHALGERAVQLTLKAFHCMHEHSLVLLRQGGRIFHSTLGEVFRALPGEAACIGGEEIKAGGTLEVWDREGWVKVKSARRHPQEAGTAMVLTRTRAGYGIVSQDNHPHMVATNEAVCPTCGTYPKHSNGGRQYYCRTCPCRWEGAPTVSTSFRMVEPQELGAKTHVALLSVGPEPTAAAPPLPSGWLAGIYCAEGSLIVQKEYGLVGFGISQAQGTSTYARIGEHLRSQYGELPRESAQPRQHQVYGKERAQHIQESFGRYPRNVGLPAGWSGYPKEWLRGFAAGVIDGDGTQVTNEDSRWVVGKVDTTSLLLAQQLHWILRAEGIPARLLLTPWRKISRHQGYAVTFVVTRSAKEVLKGSLKLAGIAGKPEANAERFGEVVDYVRPVRYMAPPLVYDLETESGTLFVNGFWTHNTGGVSSGGSGNLLNSFERFQQLMFLPEVIPNAATLAMASGKVTKIEHHPTGVDVFVNGTRHFVGRDAGGLALHENLAHETKREGYIGWTPPKVGDQVEAGQTLSDPNRTFVNPRDLYKATKNMEKVQNHMTSEVYGLYADEGIRRRAVEVVVKAMSNLTKVSDPGDDPTLLRGEFRPLSVVRKLNADLVKAGKNPIEHMPTLKGVEMMPLSFQEDWIAKMQHLRLKNTILDAAATNGVSFIHGPHPVPGVAFGAEFGLTSKNSKTPGLEHLKDVPEHNY